MELESKYKVNVMRTTGTFVDSKTFYLPLSPMKEKLNSCTCKFEVNQKGAFDRVNIPLVRMKDVLFINPTELNHKKNPVNADHSM